MGGLERRGFRKGNRIRRKSRAELLDLIETTTTITHHVGLRRLRWGFKEQRVNEAVGEIKMDATYTDVVVGRNDTGKAKGTDSKGKVRQVDGERRISPNVGGLLLDCDDVVGR